MNHHTVTTTFQAPRDEVFAYLADTEKLPEWATEFARELRFVDGRYKVVNGLGEFLFELRADADTGVIDMLAGPDENHLLCFPTRVVTTPSSRMPPLLMSAMSGECSTAMKTMQPTMTTTLLTIGANIGAPKCPRVFSTCEYSA